MSVRVSVCLSAKKNFSSKMDQIRKFGEQTSRILEFKPEGLEGYNAYNYSVLCLVSTYNVANEKKNSPKPRQVTNPNILCFLDNDGQ